jgi:GNAT superfamily N-acetyltransferase
VSSRYQIRLAELQYDWDALSWLRTAVEVRLRQMEETTGHDLTTDLARGLDRMAFYAGNDQMYLVAEHGMLAAAYALTPDGDPAFWTPAERKQEALYLDNAMVHPKHSGHGIGAVVTAHAVTEGAARTMDLLRLDCQRGNEKLRAHWEALGFEWVRDVQVPGRASGTLMEMKL